MGRRSSWLPPLLVQSGNGPIAMLTMLSAVAPEPEVAVQHEDMWLRAFLRALHDGTRHMGLPDISLEELRMRYKLLSIMSTCANAGNIKELLNMFPKERFKEIQSADDPFLTEKYVIRVYCLAPLYAFRHWDERGLYANFRRWLHEHP